MYVILNGASRAIDETVVFAAARKEGTPQVLLPAEEKIIMEEVKSNGQTVTEEKYEG